MAKWKPAGRRQTIPFKGQLDWSNVGGEMGDYDAPINHPLFKRFKRNRPPFIVSTPLQINTGYYPYFYEPSLRIGRFRQLIKGD